MSNTEDEVTKTHVEALRKNPDYRVLERMVPSRNYGAVGATAKGAIVDVETTGLGDGDKIIQLAILPFSYNPETGEVGEVGELYIGYEDPEQALSPDIINITGITDEQLKGQKLDDSKIEQMVSGVNIVIAHHAQFDRPFMDKRLPVFQTKHWACSLSDINWKEHGLRSGGLESLLQAAHGCFYDAHKAEVDCQATLHLLAKNLPDGARPLAELLERAREPEVLIWAIESPFAKKDMLKARGYKWFKGSDVVKKCWRKICSESKLADELNWLDEDIYDRKRPCRIKLSSRTRKNAFSERIGSGQSIEPFLGPEALKSPEKTEDKPVAKVSEQRSLGI